VKQLDVFPDAYHAIFQEKDRHVIVCRVRDFVVERFLSMPVVPSFLLQTKLDTRGMNICN